MKLVSLVVLLAVAAVAAAGAAGYSSAHTVTLRPGDAATGGGVRCMLNVEGGAPEMLCSRSPRSSTPFDVVITRQGVTVYREGFPDDPVFSRRFP